MKEDIGNVLKKEEEKQKKTDYDIFGYVILIGIVLGIAIFLIFRFTTQAPKTVTLHKSEEILKPLTDDRTYRLIKLQNNLEVLLISDPKSNTGSASLTVNVGSLNDFPETQGIAHLLEHMVFLGSKSYPEPSKFENVLSNYLGSTNAFTEEEMTTYYFEVGNQGFDIALDMFGKMFSEPLLDIDQMDKEINAVNSENEKNSNQDNWREMQIIKSLANNQSRFNSFGTGSTESLRNVGNEVLHANLVKLFDNFYYAENMRLVVLSNESLEEIEKKAAQHFSGIKSNTDSTIIKEEVILPFDESNLGKFVWFKKIDSEISLDFVFSFDEILTKYHEKPFDYISYIIKYSGNNSLVNLLKSKNLATNLQPAIFLKVKDFSLFVVSISLTKEGYDQIDHVISLAFSYFKLIRNEKVSRGIFEELSKIQETNFNFLEKRVSNSDYLSYLSTNMFLYDTKSIINGDYIYDNFNEETISQYINGLRPDNCLVIVGSATELNNRLKENFLENSEKQKEKWYGTEFQINNLNIEDINNKAEELDKAGLFKIRTKNPYITKENKLTCQSEKDEYCKKLQEYEIYEKAPEVYIDEKNIKIWYQIDKSFLIPKINFYLNFVYPKMRESSINYLNSFIFYNFIGYNLDPKLSEASDSGNDVSLSFDENGIRVTGSVYSDVFLKVIDDVYSTFVISSINPAIFNQVLEMTKNNLLKMKTDQPFIKAKDLFIKMVKPNTYNYEDLLSVFDGVNYDSFNDSVNLIRKDFVLRSLIYGNFELKTITTFEKKVKEFSKKFLSNTNFRDETLRAQREIFGSTVLVRTNDLPTEINSVIENFYQVGPRDTNSSLITSLIQLSWGSIFYSKLRTEQQLGYIAAATKNVFDSIIYYIIVVQGSAKTPNLIDNKINEVVLEARILIQNLTEETFQIYKDNLLSELLRNDKNMLERSDRIWTEIFERTYQFDRKRRLAENVDLITKQDLIQAFDEIFINDPKKLSVQIYNQNFDNLEFSEKYSLNEKINNVVTEDLDQFNENPLIINNKNI